MTTIILSGANMAAIRPLYSAPPPPLKLPNSSVFSPSIPLRHHLDCSTAYSYQSGQNQYGPFSASVAYNPSGSLDFPIFDDDEPTEPPASVPPTEGRYEVVIDNDVIKQVDLSPFQSATGITSSSDVNLKDVLERTIGFTINYKREDEFDPRELSEIPDIRLWFVRLDATYPWLPVLLDWRGGELARYAAMLVPHQMSMRKGLIFNPEALELFVMKKVFVVYSWLKEKGMPNPRLKAKDMARMLGFGIGDELFDLIDGDYNVQDQQEPIS